MIHIFIGVIFGIIIRHFIIEPIEVRKIRKELFEKQKKELLEKYKYLDNAKREEADKET